MTMFHGTEVKDITGIEPNLTLSKSGGEVGTWSINVFLPQRLVLEVLGWGSAQDLSPTTRKLWARASLTCDGYLTLTPVKNTSGSAISLAGGKYKYRVVLPAKDFSWLGLVRGSRGYRVGYSDLRIIKYTTAPFSCVKFKLVLTEGKLVPRSLAGDYPKCSAKTTKPRDAFRGRVPTQQSAPPGFKPLGFEPGMVLPRPEPEHTPAAPGPAPGLSELKKTVSELERKLAELTDTVTERKDSKNTDHNPSRKWLRVELEHHRNIADLHKRYGEAAIQYLDGAIKSLDADKAKEYTS